MYNMYTLPSVRGGDRTTGEKQHELERIGDVTNAPSGRSRGGTNLRIDNDRTKGKNSTESGQNGAEMSQLTQKIRKVFK